MFLQILKINSNLSTVINSYFRFFHISNKYFPRKFIAKHISKEVETQYLEKDIDPNPTLQDPNVNFFGIEGDENVIIISDHKHLSHMDFKSPKVITEKEKFFKTAFGVIRTDSKNKLRYHGQYEKKEISDFPYSNTNEAEVSRISEKNKLESIGPLYKNFTNSETYDLPHTDKKLSFGRKSDVYIKNVKYINQNNIDENSSDSLVNLNTHENADSQTVHCADKQLCLNENNDLNHSDENLKYSNTSVSYIDEQFFGDVVKDENKSVSNSDKDLSYIDEQMFEDSENLTNRYNIDLKSNVNENKNISESEISVENLSNIDKNIFQSVSFLNNAPKNEEYDKEKYLDNDVLGDKSITEDLGYIDQEIFKLSTVFYNEQKNADENSSLGVLSKSTLNDGEKETNEYSLNHVNKSIHNMPVIDTQKSVKYDSNAKNKSNFFSDNQVQKFRDTKINHFAQSSQKELSKLAAKPRKNSNRNVVNMKSGNKQSSKELNLSEEISDEVSKETGTAFDFVEKLRKERSIKSGKKAVVLGEELLDSRGFRILKHQVPDLWNATREEILTLLKSNVLYSDDDLVILNKPYGMVMHESATKSYPCLSQFLDDLAKEIDYKEADPKLHTVHRLDKETTGCLLLAKNEISADNLKSLFAQRKIIKKYWILTSRVPDPLKGVIDIPIAEGSIDSRKRMVLDPNLSKDSNYNSHSSRGKRAVTSYQVMCISGNAALVQATAQTGIKHQIRVHFGFGLSCPIIGDHKYSHLDKMAPQKLDSDVLQRLHVRQAKVRHIPMHIHAHSITIPGYLDGRDLFVMAPLPFHFRANLKKLKFKKKNQLRL